MAFLNRTLLETSQTGGFLKSPCQILVLISILPSIIFGQVNQSLRFATSTNGLNVRERPTTDSKKLITLPFGTSIFLKEVLPGEVVVGNDRGHWLKVEFQGKSANLETGYVFDKFVAAELPILSHNLSILSSISGYYKLVPEGEVTCKVPGIYVMTNGIYYIDRCNAAEQAFCVAKGTNTVGPDIYIICDATKKIAVLKNVSEAQFSKEAVSKKFIKINRAKDRSFLFFGSEKYEFVSEKPDRFWE